MELAEYLQYLKHDKTIFKHSIVQQFLGVIKKFDDYVQWMSKNIYYLKKKKKQKQKNNKLIN